MSLPDNDTLKALLAASTPGEWAWKRYGSRMVLVRLTPESSVVRFEDITELKEGMDLLQEDAVLIALAPELAAELIHLRERLATVEGERDEARRELAELSRANAEMMARIGQLESERPAKPFPLTPAGKLAQWKAAKALVENPPKVAGEWVQSKHEPSAWYRYDAAGSIVAEVFGGSWVSCLGKRLEPAGSIGAAKKAADAALIAAGWELVGGGAE